MAMQGRAPTHGPTTAAPLTAGDNDLDTPRSTALTGATLAFNAKKPSQGTAEQPAPAPRTPNQALRDNGALLAANEASKGRQTPIKPQTSGSVYKFGGRETNVAGQDKAAGSDRRDLEHTAVTQRLTQYLNSPSHSPHHLSPSGRPGPDQRSPSFIAATLAASRSVSPSPNPTGPPSPHPGTLGHSLLSTNMRHQSSLGTHSPSPSTQSSDRPDTSPIPSTKSLISAFEGKRDTDTDPIKKKNPSHAREAAARPKPRPLTPPRSLSPRLREFHNHPAHGDNNTAPMPTPGPKLTRTGRPDAPPHIVRTAPVQVVSPKPKRVQPQPLPSPPAARDNGLYANKAMEIETPLRPPNPLPSPGSARPADHDGGVELDTQKRPPSASSTSTDDTFVSASSTQSPRRGSPTREQSKGGEGFPTDPARPRRSENLIKPVARSPSLPSPGTRPKSLSRHPTGTPGDAGPPLRLESLTNAIVASNLAASRHTPSLPPEYASSPPPVPPPRRNSHHHHIIPLHNPLHHHHSGEHANLHDRRHRGSSRSPQRRAGTTMLQTLRQEPSKSDDEDTRLRMHRHRRKALGRKKHAHHEGARKRWRDEVSPRERKRYEAVWASNRGLFLEGTPLAAAGAQGGKQQRAVKVTVPPDELVANVVVRDIWSRSRLPFDELAEVWDLVDRKGIGALDKQEFVVGMWLIDQRLRGRKIPARVSDSVWESAWGMRAPRR
ncbi:hypothetical protein VTK73DRAFT_399 [Phialemonium thermophilum]|uniref:EH domain-containing protein n=1 Tax=Phialemonium thermophilum TaxID=223376 RepID=A0ABR3XEI2_9PEZI